MPRIISSHTHTAHSLKRKHFPKYQPYQHLPINYSYESAESYTKMGLLTCMFSSNSKANSNAKTTDSSISYPQTGQHISIRTFRELKAQQMLNHTWKKTETCLIMEFSRSMDDRLEEVANLPTTHMPRQSIQGPKLRPSIY
uniref:AC4 protein n=1 Tax=Crassocephalum yellow vein virus TaxID=417287 RepID=A0A5Q0UTR4_9GEMI|nr:AC4 protein [Crassocephalum yellow vein virus]QGA84549.1 AC4 protein [Crassocephalum yellow vein virus]